MAFIQLKPRKPENYPARGVIKATAAVYKNSQLNQRKLYDELLPLGDIYDAPTHLEDNQTK